MTDATTRVGVVVVHYGDAELTLRCLRALVADVASPAARVVVVDNGPGGGLAARARAELPTVTVLEPGRNSGFAGGCNLGLAKVADLDLVALLNNDAVPAPGWLGPLVAALDADPGLGAVVPKTRFDGRFHELAVEAASTWRPGRGDARELAWQPRAIEVDGVDVTARCQLVDGFWEPGRGGRWAGKRSLLRIPVVTSDASMARVQLATPPKQPVELRVNDMAAVRVPAGVSWCDVPLASEPVTVLANVGNERLPSGYGIDLGRFEADRGQHDAAREVPAWCGGAVLLRQDYLRDVGALDDRLFLYYEDLELSLRGAARGWRYRYEPTSLVDHRVGSSASVDSSWSERLRERNRLLVLARHGSPGRLVVELGRFVAVTLAYGRRELVAPVLRGATPCGWLVKIRGLALAGVLVRLPGMVASRSADRRRLRRRSRGMSPLA